MTLSKRTFMTELGLYKNLWKIYSAFLQRFYVKSTIILQTMCESYIFCHKRRFSYFPPYTTTDDFCVQPL